MNTNEVCEKIIELEGKCFSLNLRPECQYCPFQKQCLGRIINDGIDISPVTRINWALDAILEEYLLNDDSNE